ncbi:MAG: hypothetical protein AAFR98_03795 [Pseudomonadota bacterium]
MKRTVFAIVGAMLIGACTPELPIETASSLEPFPVKAGQAERIFRDVCAVDAPVFARYLAAVGGTDFNYEPVGTLYRHSTLDLTVALLADNRLCVMTFVADGDPLRFAARLARTVTPLTDADGSFIANDGTTTIELRDGGQYRFEPLSAPNTYSATLDYTQ